MRSTNYLFNKYDWFSVERRIRDQVIGEINSYNADKLLNTSETDLFDYLQDKFTVSIPEIDTNNITVEQHETKVDVSHNPLYFPREDGRPHLVDGTEILINIPFVGDASVFHIRPTTYSSSPPMADIKGTNLSVSIKGTSLTTDQVKRHIETTISEINVYLSRLRENAKGINAQIVPIALETATRRKSKLLSDRNLVASLGFKITERTETANTYVATEVRRVIKPSSPQASTTPFKPEPVLADTDYEHILKVIQGMAQVMELSPSAFVKMDEETLRSHFLVPLNGHYQGQATGETFNYNGKTDILIRADGKNIFIGECKFWGGAKKLTETIDQLLGYSSWRDTKVAILVFNRNKDFSKILAEIQETTKAHPNFKRFVRATSETSFRYVFSNKDDANRELTLTILAFNIPH